MLGLHRTWQLQPNVLATPPELVANASAEEQNRVSDLVDRILPVSNRALGLRDDAFGTYAGAQYTASQIPGAKFIGYDEGGHLLVGHNRAVQVEVIDLVTEAL